ncbi:hypothetical protein [Maribacter halichondriae]|uniref:hypothetical protein n=1 Tax=Maribacter halichondriae TaxID=2980554 RepID=UPI00235842D6|nr:hypothetical protein [Maribacter sp. Hal144]
MALLPNVISAQNSVESTLSSTEIKDMKIAVQYYWDWNSDQDPIKAITLLEEITSKNHDNWVAPYWAAYISTQIANSSDKNKIEYLDKAQSFFDQANSRYSYMAKNDDKYLLSNFNALHCLILRLKGFYFKSINNVLEANDYSKNSIEQLNNGIRNSPNNPILMVLAATEMATAKDKNFGDIIAAIALLEKAKSEFGKIKDRNTIDISYWNEHWIDSWLGNLRPPSN